MLARFKRYKAVFVLAVSVWVLMTIVCSLTPVPFSAYLDEDSLAAPMYWISESGGVYGTAGLLLLIGIVFAWSAITVIRKIVSFFAILAGLGGLLAGLAAFNEHVVKPAVMSPRPSHLYLEEKGIVKLAELYRLSDSARTEMMQKRIEMLPDSVDHVYDPILTHWTFESGFSFPSGHSQNAFLLGTVVAFLVYTRSTGRYRLLSLIPLIWAALVCISRVAIGIHTKYDVMAGATVGMLLAFIIALTGVFENKESTVNIPNENK